MSTANSLLSRAVALLARREHSRFDLARKLLRYTDNQEEIAHVLHRLQEKGLQCDRRFAETYVRSRHERFGVQRLRYELVQQQVDEHIINEVLAPLLESEYERAYRVWARKFNQAAHDQREYARQYRFLGQRGFSSDTIRKVLSST